MGCLEGPVANIEEKNMALAALRKQNKDGPNLPF
jgi:hypothetical protein